MRANARAVWTWRPLDELSQDIRFAWRTLFKHRAVAGFAIVSLALGIGANTAIYSFSVGIRVARTRSEVPMTTELEKFYSAIESIDTAMMTTRRQDGHLRSRAMANQKRAAGADLWFVSRQGTAKLSDVKHDAHVNLTYYREKTREWVSVSGLAVLSEDRAKVHELYAPDWKIWFPEEGDDRHGTPDDPRIVLIGVTVHAAEFLEVNKSRPELLFELVKGWVTGTEPELGEMHTINQAPRS